MVKKQSMGRQKIEIKKIEHEEARQVTFSKRRTGLFKKASELHTLCDAETAIIVFSPAGKAFSFGHPTVEEVTERFLAQNPNREVSASRTLVDAHRDNHLRELNRQCEELHNQLEFEKKTADKHKEEKMACHNQAWWEEPIENLGVHELEVLQASLEDLQKKVGSRMNELYVNNSVPGFAPEMNSVNALALCDSHFEAKPNPNSFVLPYGYPRGFACARQY